MKSGSVIIRNDENELVSKSTIKLNNELIDLPFCYNLVVQKGREKMAKDMEKIAKIIRHDFPYRQSGTLLSKLDNVYLSVQAFVFADNDKRKRNKGINASFKLFRKYLLRGCSFYEDMFSNSKNVMRETINEKKGEIK